MSVQATGRELAALAAAQAATPEVFDPLAFEQAAALLAALTPVPAEGVDALARILGIPQRLAEDWLRETRTLLEQGDQADPAVRERGIRRIGVLGLAWG